MSYDPGSFRVKVIDTHLTIKVDRMPTVETPISVDKGAMRLSMILTENDQSNVSNCRYMLEKKTGKLYTISDIVRLALEGFFNDLTDLTK